jgi:hypothetical protein
MGRNGCEKLGSEAKKGRRRRRRIRRIRQHAL